MTAKRYPLPKRFQLSLSERAYQNLRVLNEKYGYGNNYLLTVLLENIDDVVNPSELESVFEKFSQEYGRPDAGEMKGKV